MNTTTPALRVQADALSSAITAGDDAAVRQSLTALTSLAEGQLCATLAAVVGTLHRDLEALPQGIAMAHANLPDARQRLDHVVELTRKAADQTLDCIEMGQRIAEQLSRHTDACVSQQATELRQALRDAAAAQAYQDVARQMLGQVIDVLTRLRSGLDELMQKAGIAPTTPASGPVLPGTGAASQGDADDLLAELGL